MPELPEVETTLQGLLPLLSGRTVTGIDARIPALRRPLPPDLAVQLTGQTVRGLQRRAKYLLIIFDSGTLLLHLGMSGHLRVVPVDTPAGKHDHIDITFDHGQLLRFHDPRRFGTLLWLAGDPFDHPLLRRIGPEPFDPRFDGSYLSRAALGRRAPVKTFIMDQRVVVGVGNIYAGEALFQAGIHPERPAGQVSAEGYQRLVEAIRDVLQAAIAAGGTTLRDFSGPTGRPGYFSRQLLVYGRSGEPCPQCSRPLSRQQIGRRSSYFCATCQQ